jgi:hypothetical protein
MQGGDSPILAFFRVIPCPSVASSFSCVKDVEMLSQNETDASTQPQRPLLYWRWGSALVLATWLAQACVIWSPVYPPLVDLPDHMARHYLEARAIAGHELPAGYTIAYRVLPNLGGDLVVPPLLCVLNPLPAAKVFLTLSVWLYWLGPALFILRLGQYRPAALLATVLWLPFVMSSQFFWGFLNYYSGFGLTFLVLTHYLRLAELKRIKPIELVGHSLLIALLFLWHLAPWGLYGVIMACHALAGAWVQLRGGATLTTALRRPLIFAAATIPSLLLLAAYLLTRAHADGPDNSFAWGGWARKALMPLTLFRSYDAWLDIGTALLWLTALTVGLKGFASRHWLLLAMIVLSLLYLLIPLQLGTTSDADSRLLPAILVCALAWVGTSPLRRYFPAIALLALCLVVKIGGVAWAWDRLDRRLVQHARAFDHIPPRSRVMPLVIGPSAGGSKDFPEEHFAEWLVPLKDVFVPTLLAIPDQQPLVIDPRCKVFAHRRADGLEIDEQRVRECYDYVWLVNPTKTPVRIPPAFEVVFADDWVTLLRVR